MKNLLESIVFTKKRFKELAKINESDSQKTTSQEAASQEAKPSAQEIANMWETKMDEASETHYAYGDASTVENSILGPFLVEIAQKLGDNREEEEIEKDLYKFIDVKTNSREQFNETEYFGEVILARKTIAKWSSNGDGYGFSIYMDPETPKTNFIAALKDIFTGKV